MPIKLHDTMKEAKLRVYKEFNMTSKGVAQDIVALKEWLLKQPHLPYIHGENVDKWLENYLVLNKNSLERTKENLDMYFSVRVLFPEVFAFRDPLHEQIRISCQCMGLVVLPKLTPEGRRVFIFSHLNDNVTKFESTMMFKRMSMIFDVFLQEGVDYIGLEVIVDSKHVCLGHLSKYNLSTLAKFVEFGSKAYPNRSKSIHVVNPWPMVDTGIALFKPFLPKKLQGRMVVHRSLEDLHRCIPKNILPEDLGGEEPSIRELNDAWHEKLISYREWFLFNEDVKSDEAKRVGKCRFEVPSDTFGNQGSFRKIEVD
uniref:CRAL-TRIO domain-containing protein n=2 Tax=Clastoptera arizonana TaxID=38151 RepID=A0A1B6C1N4_9HEMI